MLKDLLEGPGWVGGPLGRSGTGRRTNEEVRDGLEHLGEVETGCGTLGEVQDRLLDSWIFPGHVGRPPGRSGTGRVTLREVQNESGDPRGGPVRVGGQSGRSGVGVCD